MDIGFEMSSSSRRHPHEGAKVVETTVAADAVSALEKERHKYQVLRQTAEEWKRELQRKQEECAMWRRRSAGMHGEVGGSKPEENLFRAVLLSAQLAQNKQDAVNVEALAKVEEDIEEQVFLLEPGEILLARQLLDREMPHQPLPVTRAARARLNDILENKNISCGRMGSIPVSTPVPPFVLAP